MKTVLLEDPSGGSPTPKLDRLDLGLSANLLNTVTRRLLTSRYLEFAQTAVDFTVLTLSRFQGTVVETLRSERELSQAAFAAYLAARRDRSPALHRDAAECYSALKGVLEALPGLVVDVENLGDLKSLLRGMVAEAEAGVG